MSSCETQNKYGQHVLRGGRPRIPFRDHVSPLTIFRPAKRASRLIRALLLLTSRDDLKDGPIVNAVPVRVPAKLSVFEGRSNLTNLIVCCSPDKPVEELRPFTVCLCSSSSRHGRSPAMIGSRIRLPVATPPMEDRRRRQSLSGWLGSCSC